MTSEEVYVEPSALARLYLHQSGSREICAWRAKVSGPLLVTHHGRTEVINAICRVAFMGELDPSGLQEALTDFDTEFASGRLQQANLLWRAALNRAEQLSRRHTPKLGTRAADVLHVACAVELGLRHFLSFDDRQMRLAAVVGLKRVRL